MLGTVTTRSALIPRSQGALFLLFIAAFWPTMSAWGQAWMEDPAYSHGFLIPIVTTLLIWKGRKESTIDLWRTSRAGLVLLVLSLSLHVLGTWGGIVVFQRFALISTVHALVLYNAGPAIYRRHIFPLLFLLAAVPLPITLTNTLLLPLQTLATVGADFCLQAVHIPVVRDGHLLTLPVGTLQVAEACSGLRSLVPFVTLAAFFAFRSPMQLGQRLLLLISAVALALVTNILRITMTGLLVHFYGFAMAEGAFHEGLGVVLSATALVILFVLAARRPAMGAVPA